ncbi:hypothetical protein HJC23_005718 [Cyclotella cryptica]|uniref:GH18 domain-containing protein n=1 Tax=Cyclotella cryptica TaxID=29204 RepID=A0ABD3QDF1_9STRA
MMNSKYWFPAVLSLALAIGVSAQINTTYNANHGADSRLIAYMSNFQGCPDSNQIDAYSHIGFGKEDQLSTALVDVVDAQNFDGIDIEYDYCYDIAGTQSGKCNQTTSAYSDSAAQLFLNNLTSMLRTKLDALQERNGYNHSRYELIHSPMDVDLDPSSKYYQILKNRSSDLDFLMPHFYNGTRPISDGVAGSQNDSVSAASIFENLANDVFSRSPNKVVFGFCITCFSTQAAQGTQAVTVLQDLKNYTPSGGTNGDFECNGGASFWRVDNDYTWTFLPAPFNYHQLTMGGCWNYDACVALLDDTCTNALWYPDWEGVNAGCLQDGNEPFYMTRNGYLFNVRSDCCDQFYWWNYDACMSINTGTASTIVSPVSALYYPDWEGANAGCLNDGKEPEYIANNPTLWMYKTLSECCKVTIAGSSPKCMSAATAPTPTASVPLPGSGLYYPDWEGANTGCLNDGQEPEYMASNPTLWMYTTLSECCEMNYAWSLSRCDPSKFTQSNRWCMSWSSNKCVQGCESWDYKYNSKIECCTQRMWWDKTACMA